MNYDSARIREILYMFEYSHKEVLDISFPRGNRSPPPAEYHWLIMKNSEAMKLGFIQVSDLEVFCENLIIRDGYRCVLLPRGKEALRVTRAHGFWDSFNHCFAEQYTIAHFMAKIKSGTMPLALKDDILKSNEVWIKPVQEALVHAILKA